MADTHAGDRIGLYGFGAAAHIVAQVAIAQIAASTRLREQATPAHNNSRMTSALPGGRFGNTAPRATGRGLAIRSSGSTLPLALRAVRKGGVVVCAGSYERHSFICLFTAVGRACCGSVANLTRADGEAFFSLSAQFPICTHVTPFSLDAGNAALDALRNGALDGAAVLLPGL